MRCDPVMMAELGGPRPREGIQEKVRSDVQDVASGAAWIKMIVPGEDTPDVVAGTVSLWSHETDGEWLSEIGWMVLPEFQGRGLGKLAVRMLLAMARAEDRCERPAECRDVRFEDAQPPTAPNSGMRPILASVHVPAEGHVRRGRGLCV